MGLELMGWGHLETWRPDLNLRTRAACLKMLLCCRCVYAHSLGLLLFLPTWWWPAGSEIVVGWEGVMSTSPLSNTFPGNLAGAARLWGPGQGIGKVVTETERGDGPTWDKALCQFLLLQPGLGFPAGFLPMWSSRPSSHSGLLVQFNTECTTSELLMPHKTMYWFPQ